MLRSMETQKLQNAPGWWFYLSEKYENQLGWWHSKLNGKNPNHQPETHLFRTDSSGWIFQWEPIMDATLRTMCSKGSRDVPGEFEFLRHLSAFDWDLSHWEMFQWCWLQKKLSDLSAKIKINQNHRSSTSRWLGNSIRSAPNGSQFFIGNTYKGIWVP